MDNIKRKLKARRRFNVRIQEKHDGCWIWLGSKDKDGYGYFWYEGKTEKAHRIAWIFIYGGIPEGLCVCHHCDNPSCVNPEHLFIGTVSDNTQDMIKKGRKFNCYGSRHGNHKLVEENVLDIKRKLKSGHKQKDLAQEYNVSTATICLISKRKVWGWLNEDYFNS